MGTKVRVAYALVGASLAVISFVAAAMVWALVNTMVPIIGFPFVGYRLWMLCVLGGAISFAIHWYMGAKGGLAQIMARTKALGT